ncbi:family 78 glycoside hydrolase catalytic domain [uncultured Parabacteroides sp.]|uniref:family 78 glycoside hydrolase catalytic domain n=1 Tax=uncultured Parabacteroides sp. TaxID=512312 RepID=UPI002585845D|nr:family 78 glycoside hydrolase catalytic domain [uncultured Parabacteroides sp.]
MKRTILLICLLVGWVFLAGAEPLRLKRLTCEYIENPLGVDALNPVLGWQLESSARNQMQSAYEIQVALTEDDLKNGKGLVWKSGKVSSHQNVNIVYSGKRLKPFTRYYWRVRTYNQDGAVSDWSQLAFWETSMLSPADWKAQWITDGSKAPEKEEDFYKDDPTPLFRKIFHPIKTVKEARLYIAGIGYYEASLNGKRIGDHILDPGWTNYGKQILYSTYDITSLIGSGENVIGVMLGNGYYNPLPMRIFKPLREYLTIGRPCLKAQLRIQYTDGSGETICTDESWKTAPGPVMRNNVYLGEHYDARNEIPDWDTCPFDDSHWKQAVQVVNTPAGQLTAQMQPPIRQIEVIKPVRMTETRPGEFIFDMGQNFAGVARLKVRGKKGTTIKIRYGEDIYSDGSLNVMTSVAGQQKKVWDADWETAGQPQTAWQEDTYTLKGEGEETWSPRFTFHGFRYIEITGWPGRPSLSDVEGIRLSADLHKSGSFECSNPMLNRLNKVLDYTFHSNLFSVQSDCPAREKFGYGGDIVGTARTFCWFYDMENFYRKALRDFANDQRPEGGMTETAPYNGIADMGLGDDSGPIGWQLAFAFMQKQLYEYYGDLRTIKAYYPTLRRQVEFLRSKAKDNLIDTCINDHESLEERVPALFATAHYYHHVILLAEFAVLTGQSKDTQIYSRLATDIKDAFIKKFLKRGTGQVANATQAAQAFVLFYDLVPESEKEAVFTVFLQAIAKWDGHIASGIFGVPAILEVLRLNNRNDIAYEMVTKKTFPGWGYMLESGATTLWETWKYSDNVYSQNHPMFGSVGEWFYQSLGGINQAAPGFSKILIKPQPAGDLTWVNCSYQSVNGPIVSNWRKGNETFELQVTIPANTTAQIWLPSLDGAEITESGSLLDAVPDIKTMGYMDGFTCLEVGSGLYRFTVRDK